MGIRTTRSNKRLLRWGTAGAAALMIGAALAAPNAHADETNYLIDLRNAGIIIYNPALAISDGYRVCTEGEQGWTWRQGANQLMRDNPGLSFNDAVTAAKLAKLDLC